MLFYKIQKTHFLKKEFELKIYNIFRKDAMIIVS